MPRHRIAASCIRAVHDVFAYSYALRRIYCRSDGVIPMHSGLVQTGDGSAGTLVERDMAGTDGRPAGDVLQGKMVDRDIVARIYE